MSGNISGMLLKLKENHNLFHLFQIQIKPSSKAANESLDFSVLTLDNTL